VRSQDHRKKVLSRLAPPTILLQENLIPAGVSNPEITGGV